MTQAPRNGLYLQGGERCARPLHGRAHFRGVEAGVRQPIYLRRRRHFSPVGTEYGDRRATWGGTGTRKGRAHYVSQARQPRRPLRCASGAELAITVFALRRRVTVRGSTRVPAPILFDSATVANT